MSSTNKSLENIHKQVDETKHLLMNNCNKIIERGEKIDTLDERAAVLNLSSVSFKKNTRKLKNKMWWQEKRCIFVAIIIIILLILIIVFTYKSKKNS